MEEGARKLRRLPRLLHAGAGEPQHQRRPRCWRRRGGRRWSGGDAGLGLDATAPPFIPAASRDSKVPQRKDRGESPTRGDAATSLEGPAKQAGLGGG